ncbi:MGDG synthase family glycosyltransferase [Nocardioides cynanchi]|uniref:MGDG synthase family glycosyltransferase n=1 Tax=Nocardioides cynanchi TaxID=2558918 RepID=UPI001246AEF2|nr:glycosyltransferase [Nocardioides cynanchi]
MSSPEVRPDHEAGHSATPGARVALVSGSFGAGHDMAAAAITQQLDGYGISSRTWDIVDLLPGRLGRVLRTGYLRQVNAMPATWRWTLDAVSRSERIAELVNRALATSEGAFEEIAATSPDMFVCTHPFAAQVLGRMRSRGVLDIPVTTYLTDMSVHRLWVSRGIDLHLAINDLPAAQARALGAGRTRVVEPAVCSSFHSVQRDPRTRLRSRRTLGLPESGNQRLALVTGGSCGIGDLLRSAVEIAATGVATPVVLCGTNRRLLEQVRRNPDLIGLGWVADMPHLLAAVDVVVQNAGGMTSLEARAAGVPMITYRCIAGHGETNAAALDATGVAPWVREPALLGEGLVQALGRASLSGDARIGPRAANVVDLLFPAPALIA